ncbi:MAG: ChaN family lipoprotein [Alphaproteobacteria bacterium]
MYSRPMFRMFHVACIALSLLATGSAGAAVPPAWTTTLSADHPLAGRLWSPDTSAFVPVATLIRALAAADLIFLGEKHDNPDHHLLQAWLLDQLAAAGKRPGIVFEMIDEDRQGIIDTHVAEHTENAAALGTALEWGESGWPDWLEYEPLFQSALRHRLPVVAGSLPRADIRNVGRKGVSALPDDRRRRLGLDAALPEKTQAVLLDIVARGHCGLMPRESLTPMVAVQRVRDAVLADNMIRAFERPETDSAVLIAGAGHARRDLAAPRTAASLAPQAETVTLAFIEVDDAVDAPAQYAENFSAAALPFDYVWFTPRANDRDYCAELRERFSGHGKPKQP